MVAGGRELIDTLWNVNREQTTIRIPAELELIDTLWNVNTEHMCNIKMRIRINRYIMECK